MIYKGLNRSGMIGDIKTHGGGEIAEVYGGIGESNPIYYKQREMIGTSPMQFKALGLPLKDYRISGNTIQDGTPTPEAPVDVVGCGVRSDNLFDKSATDTNYGYIAAGGLLSDGTIYNNGAYSASEYIAVSPNQSYTLAYGNSLNAPSVCFYDVSKNFISGIAYGGKRIVPFSIPQNAAFLRFSFMKIFENAAMLNLGSESLPYEPYGYKLPLTVNGTEYQIYLGTVPTTRRIKKVVLTGEEAETELKMQSTNIFYIRTERVYDYRGGKCMCTHYVNHQASNLDMISGEIKQDITSSFGTSTGVIVIKDNTYLSLADFKSYLAAQYAAGTPVTIWYVLDHPETAVVNEPLMKIGDYADTISFAQAGVTIPTVSGTNTLTVDTTVQPSEVSITGNIKEVITGQIYGASWDGSSATTMTRTDDAASFSNPDPYVADGNHPGSSPFDNIMPWSGMRRVTMDGNELVEIPKFWYKITKTGSAMTFQIANSPVEGFFVSPAHMDRGDGVGERDYVYVGRYHCSSTDYKSTSGSSPKVSITRSTARTNIHNLGSDYWQFDFAMFWTIRLLYLVEFANWDSQKVIGYGCGNGSSVVTMGYTDSMPYHTGTMASSRTTYAASTQYRYIEGIWDNVLDWCDGIRFSSSKIYAYLNPSTYSDSSGGTNTGTRPTSSGCISAFGVPSATDYEWALYPSSVVSDSTYSTYVADNCDYGSSGVVLYVGGNYGQYRNYGMFYLNGYGSASGSYGSVGARLQYLPG